MGQQLLGFSLDCLPARPRIQADHISHSLLCSGGLPNSLGAVDGKRGKRSEQFVQLCIQDPARVTHPRIIQ